MMDDERSIIEEATGAATETGAEAQRIMAPAGNKSFGQMFLAPAVTRPLEEYASHPLNFTGRRGLGRLIRGFEGIFGSLAYAVVDVVLGGIETMWEALKGGPKPPAGGAVA